MQTGFAMLCAGSIRAKNAKNGTYLDVIVGSIYYGISPTPLMVRDTPFLALLVAMVTINNKNEQTNHFSLLLSHSHYLE